MRGDALAPTGHAARSTLCVALDLLSRLAGTDGIPHALHIGSDNAIGSHLPEERSKVVFNTASIRFQRRNFLVVDAFRQVEIDQLVEAESGPILLAVPRRISPSGNIAKQALGFSPRRVWRPWRSVASRLLWHYYATSRKNAKDPTVAVMTANTAKE